MNRKLINGLLLLGVATGGVGTFTSCKDTEEDFRNQILVGQQDLSGQIEAIRNITDGVFKQNLEDKIKAAIDAAAAEGDWNKVKDLERQLAALQGTVTALQGTVAALDAAYKAADAALETKLMGVIAGEVATLNAAIEACREHCNAEFDAIKTQLATIEANVQDALAKANAAQAKADEAYGKAIANEASIETLKTNLAALESKVGTLEGDVATLKSDIANLQAEDAAIRELVNQYKASVDEYITKVNTLQGDVDGLKNTCTELNNKLTELESDYTALETAFNEYQVKTDNILGNIWDKLARLITSVKLERVVNPIFGGLDLPVGMNTTVLANYLYKGVQTIDFPNTDSNLEYAQTEYAEKLYMSLYSTLKSINAPEQKIEGQTLMLEDLGNVYMTVNPVANNFTGVKAQLVNSIGEPVLDELSLVKDDETVFKFGVTTRAEGNGNGLYRAVAKTSNVEEDVAKIGLEVEDGLLDAFKNAIKNHTKADFAELAKLLVKQFNNKLDAYGVKVSWKDIDQNGKEFENAVYSGYDIAATTFRPLSYRSGWGFTVDKKLPEVSPLTEYFNNYFDELRSKIKFEFNDLGGFEHIDIKLDEVDTTVTMDGDVVISLAGMPVYDKTTGEIIGYLGEEAQITLSQNGSEGVGAGDLTPLIDAIQKVVDNSQAQVDDIKDQLTTQVNDMIDEINRQLEGLEGDINNQIGNILDEIQADLSGKLSHFNRFVDYYNKIAGKINDILENPNAYLQVLAFYTNANGPHRLSTVATSPTVFNAAGGTGFDIYCTSYNAEILVPSYKKYVAITGVYENGKKVENADLKALNTNNGSMNQVVSGRQVRFGINSDKLEAGKTYEVLYQALDYRGYTSTRTYYITVKK